MFLPAVLVLCAAAQAPLKTGGIVRAGDIPVPGASVTAVQGPQKHVTTTAEDGRYELHLGPGAWSVTVEMFGFQPARREVQSGAAADFTLELKPYAAARPAAPRQEAFQALNVTQTAETQIQQALDSAPAHEAPPVDAVNANEAFLVSGSLSSGLQEATREDMHGPGRGEFGRGEFGGGPPGAESMRGGAPSEGGGPPSIMGSRGGLSGRGGGPPMMGGGGRGGPPMMGGGRGGGRDPRGSSRGGSRGRPIPGASFGNRAGRGRGGIRGALYWTLSNSALDARPYSLTGQEVPKPSYAQNRFGAMAGGSVFGRTFVFLNFFMTRGRGPYSALATLPSPLERAGDFSQSVTRAAVQIYDPLTGLPFPGNVVPASRVDRAAAGLLNFIPLPNLPGRVQNYQNTGSEGNDSSNFSIRVNRSLGTSNRIDAHVNSQWRNSTNLQLYGFRDTLDGNGWSVGGGWTHNITRRIHNNLRLELSRNRSETVPFFAFRRDVAGELGISGVARDPVNWGPPNLNFTNFGGLTDASPVLRRDQTASLNNGVTVMRGKHTFSTGFGYRRMQVNTRTDQNARGTFTFSGLSTSGFNAQGQPLAGTGFDFADFLLGLPQSSSVRFGDSNTYFRASAYSAYAMDDWRARANLTINLGLRYEYFTPYHEKFGRMANLDIAPGFTGVAVVTPGVAGPYSGAFAAGLIDPDRNNLSPRLAMAWRPFPKRSTQIRMGYGIFHNGSIYNQFPSRLAAQPPFAKTATVNTSLARTLTLANGFAATPAQSITNTYAVDRYYRVAYAQTWNFAVQQSLPHRLVVEVGYLGTKGTRLDIQRLPNRAAPGSPLTAEQRRQIGNAVGFTFDSSQGNSIYHAGQARFTRRFSRGLSANLMYTYSKSIDNASTLGGGGAVVAQNDNDLRAERGRSSFNQIHTLNLFYVVSSPISDRSGAGTRQRLLKDWTFSGGMSASSGSPFTARVMGNQSDTGGTGAIGAGRADATGLPVNSGSGFFNPAAFTTPPSGRFGNAGRNTIDGPGRVSLNLSLSRSFAITERKRVELRVDSQNFTNHVAITGLGTVVNASNYGLATAAGRMRTVNATLRIRF
ncbi:MAG: TonB-dependent receptor [Bryobacteraceae bacterium]